MGKSAGSVRKTGGFAKGDATFKGTVGELRGLATMAHKDVYREVKSAISRYHSVLGVRQREVKLGDLPDSYNAFCTRGYSDRLEYTKMEVDIARRISGCDTPNMLIYGGGKAVKEFCCKNGLIYTESFINGERKEALKGK